MRKTVFLHIGAPETGTSLQRHLWANRVALLEHGIYFPGSRQMDHSRAGADFRDEPIDDGDPRQPGRWTWLIEHLDSNDAPTAVISDERLARASAEQVAAARASLGNHDVHIVYGIREVAGMLTSQWQQNVKMAGTPPVRVWLDELAADVHSWYAESHDLADVLDRWDLPPENVHILIAPSSSADRNELWARFASIIGAPTTLPKTPPPSNESLGLDEAELLRRVYRLLDGPPPHYRIRALVQSIVSRRTLAKRPRGRPILLPESRKAWVTEQSRARQEFLSSTSYKVIGDLNELAIDERRFTSDEIQADDARMIDAGLDVIAALVTHLVDQRRQHTRELTRLEAACPEQSGSSTSVPQQVTAGVERFVERARRAKEAPERIPTALGRRAHLLTRRAATIVRRAPRTYYLHIGAPKTGTTYLQRLLWHNRDALIRNGVYLPGESQAHHFAAGSDLRGQPNLTQAPNGSWKGAWERLIQDAERSGFPKIIISNELLSQASATEVHTAIERLDGARVEIVYSVRDFAGLLASSWQQRTQSYPALPWELWLTHLAEGAPMQWFRSSHDIADVLERWRSGKPDRVHLLVLPRPGAGPDELWRRFQSIVGWTASTDTRVPPLNESISFSQAELLRQVQERIKGAEPPHERRRVTKEVIAGHILADATPTDAPRIPESLRPWAEVQSEERLRHISDPRNHVVGDLTDLRIDDSRFAPSASVPDDAAMVDTTVSIIAGLLDRTAYEAAAFER